VAVAVAVVVALLEILKAMSQLLELGARSLLIGFLKALPMELPLLSHTYSTITVTAFLRSMILS